MTETFGRRRHATLVKKAQELSILCAAEVAVIAFTSDGKLHEYSSTSSVEHTLSRYKNNKGGQVLPTKVESDPPKEYRRETAAEEKDPKSSDKVLHALKGQHAALKLDKQRRMGKALDGLSREELYALEQQQKWVLVSVMKKKEELLVRLLHRSKAREHQAIQEKENLRRGYEVRTMEKPYLQLFPENSTSFCTSSNKAVLLSNCPTKNMDTSLHLGLSYNS
ncbi:agamous-like MADS-box protein AGL15 [Rosa rugosa]|uniref:agamous-like MADS-box protein AGL15 n=1 Tax=Rosa rugosa TaxID=74645 RepID=UPI002B407C56|nr:agamous-like MADS-box protein AGL15 [Rosa rugosa]